MTRIRTSMALLAALAALAALAPGVHPLAAQAPARVLGVVREAGAQAPLAGAEVQLDGASVTTGDDGRFVFGSVAPGRHELRLRRVGYLPAARTLEVTPGLDLRLDLVLVPVVVRLDSVTVLAERPGALAIDGAELVRRGGTLAQALDGWEGVVVRRTGSGGPAAPQVRGGAPDEVLVVVDGFAINDPFTGRADLSRVTSREVQRVTLLPGAQGTRTGGRAVAGVIVVDTRARVAPEASLSAGSFGARALRVGGTVGRATLALGAERAATAFPYDVPEVRGSGEAERANADAQLYTMSGRLDGPVAVTLRASASRRGLPGTTTNPSLAARAEDGSALLGLRGGGATEWSASLEWLRTRARDSAPAVGAAYDSRIRGLGAGASVAHHTPFALVGWRGDGAASLEGRVDRFDGDGVQAGGASFRRTALRLDAVLRRGAVSLSPTVRLDLWDGLHGPKPSARLDAAWQAGATAFTAAVGSAVTPPVLADLLFREGVGVRVNPDLRPERVRWEVEAGVRRALGARGSAALRLYQGRVDDMVLWTPSPAYHFTWMPANFDVRRRGAEATLEVAPAAGLRLGGSVALADVRYARPEAPQVPYRPRWTAAASATWSRGPWLADARWSLLGARLRDAANALPAISLVHLGLERRFGAVLLRGDVHDLTDTRAEFIAGYPTPGRSFSLTLTYQVP